MTKVFITFLGVLLLALLLSSQVVRAQTNTTMTATTTTATTTMTTTPSGTTGTRMPNGCGRTDAFTLLLLLPLALAASLLHDWS